MTFRHPQNLSFNTQTNNKNITPMNTSKTNVEYFTKSKEV